MKGYSLQAEHPNHFEVSHPNDGIFKVAKGHLDDKTIEKIRKMPRAYQGGGEVDPEIDPGTSNLDALSQETPEIGEGIPSQFPAVPNAAALFNAPMVSPTAAELPKTVPASKSVETATPEELGQLATTLKKEEKAKAETPSVPNANLVQTNLPTGQAQPAPAPVPAAMPGQGLLDKSFKEREAGIAAQQAAAEQQSRDTVDAYQKWQTANVAAAKAHQTELEQNEAQHQEIIKSIQDQKIDPNRVWNKMSTGNTVLAAIGMVLSGIGSGLTGQPNMAMSVINKSIENDIDAQKAELGKKETLLSDNLRKYGNLQQAYAATRSQLYSVAQGQIAEAAAKASGAEAKARAQMLYGELDAQRGQVEMQRGAYLQNAAIGQALGSGALAGASGLNLEDPRLAPFKDRMIKVPGGGWVLATDKTKTKEVQSTLTSLDKLDKQMDELIALNKGGATFPGSTADEMGDNAKAAASLQLGELFSLKRINEYESKKYDAMVKHPGSIRSDKALAGYVQMKKFINNMRNSEFQNNTENFNPGAAVGGATPAKGQ